MNALIEWLQGPWTQRLGWTLVHFIWQGTVWAGIFAWVRHALRNAPANRRYAAGCGALLLMVATLTFTFVRQAPEPVVAPPHSTASQASVSPAWPKNAPVEVVLVTGVKHSDQPSGILFILPRLPGSLTKFMPWFVAVWFAGVTILSLRLFTGWLKILSVRSRHNQPAEACLLEKLRELKRRLGISRPVRLLTSVAVEVPTAIGWLCPVILLPASSLLGLNPAQVESILAHELAHIRRYDYLVNLLQCLAETLLFYHPAVWWVSKCIRAERENCCDDLAVQVCGDALSYAKALATLEELRGSSGVLAMAANGKPLLERIRRLVTHNAQPAKRKWTPTSAGSLGLILVMAALFALPHAHSQKKEPESKGTNVVGSVKGTNGMGKLSVQETMRKLDETVLEEVSFDAPLSEVLVQVEKELKRRDPSGPEIKFSLEKSESVSAFDLGATLITVQPVLRNITVSQLLPILVKVAEKPIQYSVGEGRVVFISDVPSPKAYQPLYPTRSFAFDPNEFVRLIKEKEKGIASGHETNLISDFVGLLQREYHVDLSAPGRQVFMTTGVGSVIVRATSDELEVIGKFMEQLEQRVTASAEGRGKIVRKLQAIKVNGVRFENAPLLEVIKQLRTLSKDGDPEHKGVNFMIAKKLPRENETEVKDSITVEPLPDMKMYALLEAVVRGSASPLQFKVEDYCVIFSSSNTVPLLRIRSFRFDPNTFIAAVSPWISPQAAATENKKIEEACASLFNQEYGLDLGAPGKQVSYRPGRLTVRATEDDLTVIETFIEKIDQKPSPASDEFKKGNQYMAPQSTNRVKVERKRKIENSPTTNAAPALYTRVFKVDPNIFSTELKNRGNPDWSRNADGSTPDVVEIVRRAFQEKVFDTNAPGRRLFFNPQLQQLMIRGTLQELDKTEKFFQLYNEARPQVTIEVKIVEVVDQKEKPFSLEELLPGLTFYRVTNASRFESSNKRIYRVGKITVEETLPTNVVFPAFPPASLAILNDGQFRWAIRGLELRPGVDLLSAPRVTTLSSRQTQIKIVDVKTFPTEFNGTANAPTEQVELGPVIDVVPFVAEDKLTISLSVIARVKEFLGYDLSYSESPRRTQTPPTPSFRQREAKAVANVYDGQTLVLDAGVITVQQVVKDRVPMLADVPFIGNLFRSEKKQIVNKRLLFFITPTIIDPAGNRIHNEEREEIPPQPAK